MIRAIKLQRARNSRVFWIVRMHLDPDLALPPISDRLFPISWTTFARCGTVIISYQGQDDRSTRSTCSSFVWRYSLQVLKLIQVQQSEGLWLLAGGTFVEASRPCVLLFDRLCFHVADKC